MYQDREGIVDPRPKPAHFDPLAYIANFFGTVEVNSSFYGPPVPRRWRRWELNTASSLFIDCGTMRG
jgi:uncharacterized protein YecE (DUF72 family)